MKPPKSDTERAADALEYEAELIRRSYTVIGTGEWPDWDAAHREQHARHDDYLALANRLRKGGG